MAAPPCMSNDGNPAVFLGTFLTSGDSVALCNECLPAFTAAITADMLGIDQELFGVALAAMEADATGDTEPHPEELAAPPAQAGHEAPTDEPPASASSEPDFVLDEFDDDGRTDERSPAPAAGADEQ